MGLPDTDVLNQVSEDEDGLQPIGLLLRGRPRPLRGEKFEYEEVDEQGVWIITAKDGTRLVLKASAVAGIEFPARKD